MAEKQRTSHSFIVRIWWEPSLACPNGRPLWRGRVQHAASGQYQVFQSVNEMVRFIQSHTGDLAIDAEIVLHAANDNQPDKTAIQNT
jgi:hypothetical protein